jgi:arylformamidase
MLIDITRPIHEGMAIYPGNPDLRIHAVRAASEGVSALSEITIGSHTGTHIDTLLHIDPQGSGTEVYLLDQYIGEAEVVEIDSSVSAISGPDILPTVSQRVLLKTRNSQGDVDMFDPDFVALTEDGAKELIRRGVRLVGIDGPSIKKKGVSDKVHELFLKNNIVVVEGIWLKDVVSGKYTLMCLPLTISRIDGVPVRAVLDSN